jgi:glutathione S-transferase
MLEENTYWHIVHVRYVLDEAWSVYRPCFESLFPPVVGKIVPTMIRRKTLKALHAQGLGRHQPAEVLEMGKHDISVLATVLGDKPFLLGEQPTSFDATVYAFLASITAFPVDSPFRRFVLEQKNLVQYVDRFQQRFFANWSPPA